SGLLRTTMSTPHVEVARWLRALPASKESIAAGRTMGVVTTPALRQPQPMQPAAGAPAPKRVLLAKPRGYCSGVDRAVQTVEEALKLYGAPIYVRKEIVHNRHVV